MKEGEDHRRQDESPGNRGRREELGSGDTLTRGRTDYILDFSRPRGCGYCAALQRKEVLGVSLLVE